MKKAIPILLTILMFIMPELTSCSEEQITAETDVIVAETIETEAKTDTDRTNIKDNLPDNLDFDGAAISFISRDNTETAGQIASFEIATETLNGENINDAIYYRNLTVSDRLNVKIENTRVPDVNTKIKACIIAGDDTYHVAVGNAVTMMILGNGGYFLNLMGDNMTYLDLDMPWWSQHYIDQARIGNKLVMITGDISLTMMKLMFVTYFNKQMIIDYNLDDLYSVVLDNKWTIDYQLNIIKDIYQDINGNGKTDTEDIYGFSASDVIGIDPYYSCLDLTIINRDENGIPYADIDLDKFTSAYDKIYKLFWGTTGSYIFAQKANEVEAEDMINMMSQNHLLFMNLRLYYSETMRDMDVDYGILPMPKYDEVQENYYSYIHDQYSAFCVPGTNVNLDLTSAVLEAMCAESYRSVTPEYIDVSLAYKYTRDENSSKMLDIAISGIKLDFAWIYANCIPTANAPVFIRNPINQKVENFASVYAKYEIILEKSVTTCVEEFLKNNT